MVLFVSFFYVLSRNTNCIAVYHPLVVWLQSCIFHKLYSFLLADCISGNTNCIAVCHLPVVLLLLPKYRMNCISRVGNHRMICNFCNSSYSSHGACVRICQHHIRSISLLFAYLHFVLCSSSSM